MLQPPPIRGTLLSPTDPLSRDIVGLWVCNAFSGNKVCDSSGYGNMAVLPYPPNPWLDGGVLLGESVSEVMAIPHKPEFNFAGGDCSFEIFFRAVNVPTGGSAEGLICKYRAVGSITESTVSFIDADVYHLMGFRCRDAAGNYMRANSTTGAVVGGEYHFVGVRKGDTVYIYINGVLEGSDTDASVGNCDNSDPLNIGRVWSSDCSNIIVRKAAVYKRALSAEEIGLLCQDVYRTVGKIAVPSHFLLGEVKEISGTVAAQSGVTGAAKVSRKMVGAPAATSTVAGSLIGIWTLAGTVAAQSAVSGNLAFPGGLSNYAEDKVLNHITGKATFNKPTIYLGFCIADPGEGATGADCNEVANTNGYGRIAIAAGDWNSASGGSIDNVNAITSPVATGPWGTLTHYVLVDSPTYGQGNVVVYDELDDARAIDGDDIVEFAAGELCLTLD